MGPAQIGLRPGRAEDHHPGADLPGGRRQAGPVPADQHPEEPPHGEAVLGAGEHGAVRDAEALRLRGSGAQVLEEHYVRGAHLRGGRVRQHHRRGL